MLAYGARTESTNPKGNEYGSWTTAPLVLSAFLFQQPEVIAPFGKLRFPVICYFVGVDCFRVFQYRLRPLPDDAVFRADEVPVTLVRYCADDDPRAEPSRGGKHIIQVDDGIRPHFQKIDGLAEPSVLRLERRQRREVIEAVYLQDNADIFSGESPGTFLVPEQMFLELRKVSDILRVDFVKGDRFHKKRRNSRTAPAV